MLHQKRNRALTLAVLALGFCGASAALAAVTPDGDTSVAPDSSQDTTVGNTGTGTLDIDGGSTLTNKWGYLAYEAGSSGTVTVKGTGSTWTNSVSLYVGHSGQGTLTIEGGGQVSDSTWDRVGYRAGSVGVATVKGTGSIWVAGTLDVGSSGNGTLTVENGGQVSSSTGSLGWYVGSTGAATVYGAGSTWINDGFLFVGQSGSGRLTVADGGLVTAKTLFASPADLHGNGTITANGAVLDADLVFDRSHGKTQTLAFGSGGTLKLTANQLGAMGAGHQGIGSLRIADAVVLTSSNGYLGYNTGSRGMATVIGARSIWFINNLLYVGLDGSGTLTIADGGQVSSIVARVHSKSGLPSEVTVRGTGSTWTNGDELYIGRSGTLTIEAGGQVFDSMVYVGDDWSVTGTATVSGSGSRWANSDRLHVGKQGLGTVTVANGGLITAKGLSIYNRSTFGLHVSGNDMVVLGDAWTYGTMANGGAVKLFADALLPAGTYRPISAYPGKTLEWSGAGSYKAFGGTWNNTAKTFTILAPTPLSAGASDMITTGERLLFTDDLTGQRVGASFGSITGSVSFSAALMGDADLAGLAGLLEDGRGVLSAWNFTTNFTGGEAMLSFDIGPDAEDLAVWHYTNGVWSSFTPSLFTYDSHGLASFTVSSFSGYALTAAVPEPASLGLLAFIALPLLRRQRKSASA